MNTTSSKLLFGLYRFNLFFLICWGARAWFTWFLCDPANPRIQNLYMLFSCIISYGYYARIVGGKLWNNKSVLIIVILCIVDNIHNPASFFYSCSISFMKFFPLVVLLNDRIYSSFHISFIAKALAIILVPGLLLHVIYLTNGLPFTIPVVYPTMELYTYFNYIFVLKGALDYEFGSSRFQSVFLEPGYLGTLCVFLLYARKFDFSKKENLIILISLFASLSLAGYVIGAIAYLFVLRTKSVSVRKYLMYLLLGCTLFYLAPQINGGDNVINKKIVERLQYDKSKGISGNNRVSDFTDSYYDLFLQSGDLLFGVGNETVIRINGGGANDGSMGNQIRGAGYKVFFIINGIFSAILYLIVYILLIPNSPYKKRYEYGYLILVIITFVQVAYPWSWAWLVPYVLGLNSHFIDLKRVKMCKNENRNCYFSKS